jgi:hypothetical protein
MATAVAVLAASLIVAPRPSAGPSDLPRQSRLERIEPYRGWTAVGGQSRYAIPAVIVECESRGEVHESSHPYSSSGLYQIELSTWVAFGGRLFAALPYLASKLQQSIVARRIWFSQGAGAWTCAWLTGWL